MNRVLTFGVFDYFHYGHLRLFERARNTVENPYLIVAVQDGEFILKYKPQAKVRYDTETRVKMVSALRVVDEVVLYRAVDEDIKQIEFDTLILGGDQNHAGFQRAIQWCAENGKKVIRLDRTPGICSTEIKEQNK